MNTTKKQRAIRKVLRLQSQIATLKKKFAPGSEVAACLADAESCVIRVEKEILISFSDDLTTKSAE